MEANKFCEEGNHMVTTLFWAKRPDRKSACMSCARKYGKPIGNNTTQIDRGEPLNKPLQAKQNKIKANSPNDLPKLLREAENAFNAYIRKRDSFEGFFVCISCDIELPVKLMQAGHFQPKTYSATRFHEDNTNGECVQCNCMNDQHLVGYAVNLERKIGSKRFKMLEEKKNQQIHWDRQELLDLIAKYK